MEAQKVDLFLATNAKYLETHSIPLLRERLLKLDDSKWLQLSTLQFKDPTSSLIVSLLAGPLGIDRFMIGDIGIGVGKLLTCGGFGVWTIVDWFLIQPAAREKNLRMIEQVLAF